MIVIAPIGFKSMAPISPTCSDVTTWNEAVTSNPPTFTSGRSFIDKFGNKYMYVLFGYGSAQGDFVCVDFSAAANIEGTVKVVAPATANLENLAGIAMNAVTSAQYGFIQTSGYSQVAVATSGAITAGDSLKVTNAGGVTPVSDAAKGSVPTYANAYAKAIVAPASNSIAAGGIYFFGCLKSAG